MTRDWKSLLHEYRRLLVAIFISLLVHLFIIGQYHFVLPNLSEEHFFINAQLVTPKPEAVVKSEAIPPNTTQTKATKVKKLNEPKPEPTSNQADLSQSKLDEAVQSAADNQTDILDATQDVPEAEIPDTAAQDTGLIDKPHPYDYVETEFDVRTDIDAKFDSSAAGRAKITYSTYRNGEKYQLKSLIEARGLASLIIPDLLQISDGFISQNGLQPEHYLYQFGDKKDKTYQANFDKESRKLTLHSSKGDKQVALLDGAQDLLSFMYQFMFEAPMQNMQLAITNGRKLDVYDYSFEGEEIVNTKMGDIKTIHLLRTSGENEKDELWLAVDYQYVPVKIRKTDKDNKIYELLATSLKTAKPPA